MVSLLNSMMCKIMCPNIYNLIFLVAEKRIKKRVELTARRVPAPYDSDSSVESKLVF